MNLGFLLEQAKKSDGSGQAKESDSLTGSWLLSHKTIGQVVYCTNSNLIIGGANSIYACPMGDELFNELKKHPRFSTHVENLSGKGPLPDSILRHDGELVGIVKSLTSAGWDVEEINSDIYFISVQVDTCSYNFETVIDLSEMCHTRMVIK